MVMKLALEKNSVLNEKYRVVEIIEQNPFYTTATVEHLLLNRYEILYLISKNLLEKKDIYEVFLRGVQKFVSLISNSIPDFLSFGEYNEIPFFTHKYIAGKPIQELLTQETKIPREELLSFFIELVSNLIFFQQNLINWEYLTYNDVCFSKGNLFFSHINFARYLINYRSQFNEEENNWFDKSPGLSLQEYDFDLAKNLFHLGELFYEALAGKGLVPAINKYKKSKEEREKLKKKKRDLLSPLRLNENIPETFEIIILKAIHPGSSGGYNNLNELLEDLLRIEQGKSPKPFLEIAGAEGESALISASTPSDQQEGYTIASIWGTQPVPEQEPVIRVRVRRGISFKKMLGIFLILCVVIILTYAGKYYIPLLLKKNHPPVALISTNITSCQTGEEVLLDGTKSNDPENDLLDFYWEIVSPETGQVIFSKNRTPEAGRTKVTFLTTGKYRISLKVFDGKEFSQTIYINVDVN